MMDAPPRDKREVGLFRFFIRQKVLINLIFFGIFIGGLVITLQTTKEAFGSFDFDLVLVQTPFPGATPEEVETLVTLPLENAIKPLEGIDEMSSVSVEGLSVITVKLDPDVEDTQKTVRNIEREVDRIRTTDLPADGDEPLVQEITSAFPVLTIALSGEVEETVLRDLAEAMEDEILDIKGVSRVNMVGFKEKEIWVESDIDVLEKHHLSLLDVTRALASADHSSPGGRLEIAGKEIIVRTLSKLEYPEDVRRVVVRTNIEGRGVRVGEIAEVSETLERERHYVKVDGTRSIQLLVLKKKTGDTLEIDEQLKALVERFKENADPKIEFNYVDEISFYIRRRLNVLLRNGATGMVLVVMFLFIFLSPHSALWTASAIPFAFLGGILTMSLFGITINLISLFAFILVSGMLVDNGIVVSEYIERKREEGLPRFTAESVGVSQMALPVFAAGITTIIAFAPLAFMSGIIGKFLRQMPIVLVACLVADMLECLFVLPGHLYHYSWSWRLPRAIERGRTRIQGSLRRLESLYKSLLRRVVRRPYATVGFFFLVLAIMTGLSKAFMRFELFPVPVEEFMINFELPVGAALDSTAKVAEEMEKVVFTLPKDDVDAVVTKIGQQGEQDRTNTGTHLGDIRVMLDKTRPGALNGDALINEIHPRLVEIADRYQLKDFAIDRRRGGPPTGKAIEVRLIHSSFDVLQDLSASVQNFLRQQPGVIGVKDDFDPGKDEVRLKLNRDAIGRAGVTPAQVATVVRAAYDGDEVVEIKRVGEKNDISLKVKLKEQYRKSHDTLGRLTITTPRGTLVPISALVSVSEGKGLLTILHTDAKRSVTVNADINPEETTSQEANAALEEFLRTEIRKFPRAEFEFGGEEEDRRESMASLFKAIFIAVGLIYIVLATLFQSYMEPLLIISVIPFALIGIFIALLLHALPMSLLVLVGFTGLMGVVVNNSILLLETFNREMEQNGRPHSEAIVEGATTRLRPILLTSMSTFCGVAPLGYGIGGREPFLEHMALTFGWGLLFASAVTLLWMPALFEIISRWEDRFAGWLHREKKP